MTIDDVLTEYATELDGRITGVRAMFQGGQPPLFVLEVHRSGEPYPRRLERTFPLPVAIAELEAVSLELARRMLEDGVA